MKFYLKTILTPEVEIFDTDQPEKSSWLQSLLKPQIVVRNEQGEILYVYGQGGGNLLPFFVLALAIITALKIVR